MASDVVQRLAAFFGDVDAQELQTAVTALEEATGSRDVVEKLVSDIEESGEHLLSNLGLSADLSREELRRAINDHLAVEDAALRRVMLIGGASIASSLSTMRNVALEMANTPRVWALKWDRARRILEEYPPPNVMKHFGASTIGSLLEDHDIKHIFAGLRFTESTEWMHATFDAAYRDLTPGDFEERELEAIVLGKGWGKIARAFVEKKHHNLSHLKELGVVFIIPVQFEGVGTLLRIMALLIHYVHEVPFYSRIFRHLAEQSEDDFAPRFISLLRGDVPEARHRKTDRDWLVVQRYLVKEDPNDKRLSIPHVNPEALHYLRAARDYIRLGKRFEEIDVEHWDIGSYNAIVRDDGPQSLDLIDNIMSLADSNKGVEYSYHQHEALWNELLARFIGEDRVEDLMIRHLFDGVIAVKG